MVTRQGSFIARDFAFYKVYIMIGPDGQDPIVMTFQDEYNSSSFLIAI